MQPAAVPFQIGPARSDADSQPIIEPIRYPTVPAIAIARYAERPGSNVNPKSVTDAPAIAPDAIAPP